MRGLSTIILTLFFSTALTVSSSFGIDYDTDFLEPGNPGGWETSLKTFDADQDVVAGKTFDIEIWLRGASGLGVATQGFFYLDFTGYTDKIAYVSAGRALTDESEGVVGPWTPGLGNIINEPDGVGTLIMVIANFEGVTPDADGDIIMGKITLKCLALGDAHITVDLRGVFVWYWDPWNSEEYNPATIVMHQVPCTENESCDDGLFCNGSELCNGGVCSFTLDNPCEFCTSYGCICDEDGDLCVGCYADDECDGVCNPGESDPHCTGLDNCPNDYNPNQEDTFPPQGNGVGDACECEGDFDRDLDVDAEDVTTFLGHFGRSQYFNPCTNQNQCHGDFLCDGDVDAADVTKFLEDFGRNPYHSPCFGYVYWNWCVYEE